MMKGDRRRLGQNVRDSDAPVVLLERDNPRGRVCEPKPLVDRSKVDPIAADVSRDRRIDHVYSAGLHSRKTISGGPRPASKIPFPHARTIRCGNLRQRLHNNALVRMRLFLLLILCIPSVAAAQLIVESARGNVGQEVRVVVRLNGLQGGGQAICAGKIALGNSTVFYPERFVAPAGDSMIGFSLRPVTDSLYDFSLTLLNASNPRASGDTLAILTGEALAGSDSLCTLDLREVIVNGSPVGSASSRIVTTSIGPPLPYVRFATLEQNYPNPIRRGQSTTWGYRIDKPSDVRFVIYTSLGQELDVIHLGLQGVGPHIFTYLPGITTPSGVYWARLVTSTGSAEKPFHIVR